jgi:hypothetical protein
MGNCCSKADRRKEASVDLERQSYNPIIYASAQAPAEVDQMVTKVHFVAESVLTSGGNHWTIFFETSNEFSSVRINICPSDVMGARIPGHGFRGQMILNHQEAPSQDNQHIVSFIATPKQTVHKFVSAIIDAGNHEYDFTTQGRGCTGWMLDQYDLFVGLGFIQPGPQLLENAIKKEWQKGEPLREWTITRGFYMRDTRGGGWGMAGSLRQ